MAWTVAMDCGKEYLPGLVSTGLSSVSRVPYKGTRKRPPQCVAKNEVDDDDLTEKKRRLTLEQVNFLETSFTVDPKLEPERKDLIAKQLGVRPRQVAIWFQNRRARWKNKQVEQDYESLKASYDAVLKEKESLAEEYESALEGNKRLQAEVTRLKSLVQGIKDKDATRKLSPAKEEQQSDKSELMSPTKSADEQSEIEDLLIPSDVAEVATMTNPSVESTNSAVTCGVRLEGEWPPFLPSESVFSSVPLLVQQLVANGYCFEDAYDIFLGCENSFMVGWHDMCDNDF